MNTIKFNKKYKHKNTNEVVLVKAVNGNKVYFTPIKENANFVATVTDFQGRYSEAA
jgi:hypothetical protein